MAATTTLIDESRISPPPSSVSPPNIVTLNFFDLPWVSYTVEELFFYELFCTSQHFKHHILPHLKKSLSLTLRYFFPFASTLTCPPLPNTPYLLYNENDGIQLTVVESDADFNTLAAAQNRGVKTLKSLVPKLPYVRLSSIPEAKSPVMAIKISVFPNSGISIGVASNHAAGDGRSINLFMKYWASVHKSQGNDDSSSLLLPICDRDIIIPDSNRLSSLLLNDALTFQPKEAGDFFPAPEIRDYVMVTLCLKQAKTEQLKSLVKTEIQTNEIHISSFTVICAFTWVNLLKLQEQVKGKIDDDKMCYFLAPVDCRERLLSHVPGNYMGNCLKHMLVSARKTELMGDSGVIFAAKVIGRRLYEIGREEALKDAEKWHLDFINLMMGGDPLIGIAGSPKFQVYDTDFGWGRPRKFDMTHIDPYGCFSLTESRDEVGGHEIGMVIDQDKVPIFNAIFDRNLN